MTTHQLNTGLNQSLAYKKYFYYIYINYIYEGVGWLSSSTLTAEINQTEAHPYLQMQQEGRLAVAIVVDGSTKELNRSPPTRKYERVGWKYFYYIYINYIIYIRGSGLAIVIDVNGGNKQNRSPPILANARGWAGCRCRRRRQHKGTEQKPTHSQIREGGLHQPARRCQCLARAGGGLAVVICVNQMKGTEQKPTHSQIREGGLHVAVNV